MKSALRSDLWWLATMVIVHSVVGLVYYPGVTHNPVLSADRVVGDDLIQSYRSSTGGAVLAGLLLLVVWSGVYPSSLHGIISDTILDLL